MMPWILWRHILIEITKVLLLTTAVIVVVVAFGAVVRPIAQGVLGPIGIAKYIALATIPMLQFSLPFSAGFAATMVMNRFASDNEVLAMSASGLSYRKVFVPVAAMGLALSLCMLALVEMVIPRFLGRMEQVIADDAASVVVSALAAGESFTAGSLIIHADRAALMPGRPPSGAQQRIVLDGVAAIELDGSHARTEFVARQAVVDLHAASDGILLKMAMHDATVIRPADGTFVRVPEARPEAVRLLRKNAPGPNTMPWVPLEEEIAHPEQALKSRAARLPLDDALLRDEAWAAMRAALAQVGVLKFRDLATDRVYDVSRAELRGDSLVPADGGESIGIAERDGDRTMREAKCRSARLSAVAAITDRGDSRIIRLSLVPEAFAAVAGQTALTSRSRLPTELQGLTPLVSYSQPDSSAVIGPNDPSQPLVSAAAGAPEQSKLVAGWRRAVSEVYWEDVSHRWQRFGQVVAVALTLALGAVLGVWRRYSLPLIVFLLAFIPAIADMILISSGQQHIRAGEFVMGMSLMWSGNLLMLLVLAASWLALSRH